MKQNISKYFFLFQICFFFLVFFLGGGVEGVLIFFLFGGVVGGLVGFGVFVYPK